MMGEIAEMVVAGEICQQCGDEIEEPPGHPVTCPECLSDEDKRKDPLRKAKKK